MAGSIEVDEAYMGDLRENTPKAMRKTLNGCGPVGKAVAAGFNDWETDQISAEVAARPYTHTLLGFIAGREEP